MDCACGICGKKYATIKERHECEGRCLKEDIKRKQESRLDEIQKKYEELNKMLSQYYKDYNSEVSFKAGSDTNHSAINRFFADLFW